jgi:DNA-binding response OmpR family regulator
MNPQRPPRADEMSVYMASDLLRFRMADCGNGLRAAGSVPPGRAILAGVRVLVVEDDDDLRFAITAALRGSGLAVDETSDLSAADEALFVNSYDCVVFDRMLAAGDSADYVRRMRSDGGTVPVLFLTARDTVADRVEGFATGGDDYLVKPFAVPEMIARVHNLCRRSTVVRPPVVRLGGLEIDTAARTVRRDNVLLTLTIKEFAVLEILATRPGEAVRRGELIERCWDEMAEPNSNVVEVLVSQLRRKLGDPPLIETVRGIGYRLDAPQ